MRRYLGPKPPFDYQVARDNKTWTDHIARTLVTAGLIAWQKPSSVIDPACGDGSIVLAADGIHSIGRILFGDIGALNCQRLTTAGRLVHHGSIEETLSIGVGGYDMVVLTEILEHVEDPDALLRLARKRALKLVASSPEMRPGQVDDNDEHLWMFDHEGYQEMLGDTGWRVIQKTKLKFPGLTYDYGIWVCG